MNIVPIKRVIISVSDKLGLTDFAKALAAHGVEIYASGGTRKHLEQAGLPVKEISAYTGFPEMMDGRLKTLHPKVHGGILCRHDRDDDLAAMRQHGIVSLELVVVNLYPFEATVARAGATDEEALAQIDIGGPTLIRGAAKNHAFTAVAISTEQYAPVLDQIAQHGGTTLEFRRKLAAEAFQSIARYDRAIADYFAKESDGAAAFPDSVTLNLSRREVLRYGENPHQQAALYALPSAAGANLVSARQVHGKELSYNNLLDLDAALTIVRSLPETAAVVIKHNNPCGAASANKLSVAMRNALDGDAASAFGGIVGLNRPLDGATAEVLAEPERFIEAIVAPEFEPAGLEILRTKPKWKSNVRLLQVGALADPSDAWQYRPIEGGFLMQQADLLPDPDAEWQVATETKPTEVQLAELKFAWAVVRHVKSNAIVLTANRTLVGVGAGQMSRVDSTQIAIQKAGPRARGAVLASDAFFPFADSISLAAAAGVSAVIQPGGSKRDEEVIAACNQHGIPMVFTGRRHFKHQCNMSILDDIVASKRREINTAKAARSEAQVRAAAEAAPPPRGFFDALAADGPIRLIAEVKKASPSAGVIRADFDPVKIAGTYEQHGATCLSVLTDEPFFQGKLDDLRDIRAAVNLPVLRKDFVLDSYQVYEARAAGADAVLLIAECLDDCHLRALYNEIVSLGMSPLVELYDPANLPRILEAGATLIGINNRDLRTFKTDLDHTLRLREKIPNECVLVAESGIRTRADVQRLESAGVDAILVGETLMANPDIGAAVDALLGRA